MIKHIWCQLFHRRYWLSHDIGTWWTEWDIHGGRYDIECTKCGELHVGWHDTTKGENRGV